MHIGNTVREYWKKEGVPLGATISRNALTTHLRTLGIAVAEDYVDFLAITNGMEDGAMDPDLWSCWDFARLTSNIAQAPTEFLPFGDWLIDSHRHYLLRESNEVSSVWCDWETGRPEKVAETLEQFFTRYLEKDISIGIYFEIDDP